jgi:hypothetical protein
VVNKTPTGKAAVPNAEYNSPTLNNYYYWMRYGLLSGHSMAVARLARVITLTMVPSAATP